MENMLEKQQGMTNWQTMKEQAQVLLKSGFLPASIKTAEQCLAIALTGRELGIGFMESVRGINVIQGKPSVSPQLMLALANRTGELEDCKIEIKPDRVTVTVKRRGRTAHTEIFGDTESQAMGLSGKDNYKKQKAVMYKWRAMAACLRVTFPDAISGLYTLDEMGADVVIGEDESMSLAHEIHESPQTSKPIENENDERIFQGIIQKVEIKTGSTKKPKKNGGDYLSQWKRYGIHIEDEIVGTFDSEIGDMIHEGEQWEITAIKNGQFWNIVKAYPVPIGSEFPPNEEEAQNELL